MLPRFLLHINSFKTFGAMSFCLCSYLLLLTQREFEHSEGRNWVGVVNTYLGKLISYTVECNDNFLEICYANGLKIAVIKDPNKCSSLSLVSD